MAMRLMKLLSFIKDERGTAMVIGALALPVILGMGALAVDVGYLYTARNQMQNAADSAAIAGAQVMLNGGDTSSATTAAVNFANQNTGNVPYLTGASTTVSFPAANTVQTNIAHNSVGLFFASILGVNTANVTATATAQFGPITTAPAGGSPPLAIYCNNASGCANQLKAEDYHEEKYRHCGNFFGSSGVACNFEPSEPEKKEIFLVGVTYDNNDTTNTTFRDQILNGYPGEISYGQPARALPGTRQGWESDFQTRLDTQGGKMIVPVVTKIPGAGGTDYNVKVIDFAVIEVTKFVPKDGKTPDKISFHIVKEYLPVGAHMTPGQGLGIGSMVGVRLTN